MASESVPILHVLDPETKNISSFQTKLQKCRRIGKYFFAVGRFLGIVQKAGQGYMTLFSGIN